MTDILLSGCLVVIIFAAYTAIKVWWWNKPYDKKKKIRETIKAIIDSPFVTIIFSFLFVLFCILAVVFLIDPVRYYGLRWHEYWFLKELL